MQIICISVHVCAAPKSPNSSVVNLIFAIISIVVAQSGVRENEINLVSTSTLNLLYPAAGCRV